MRKPNQLKQRLKAGEAVFGPWCVIPSPTITNIVGAAGMDFAIIDLEHGPTGFKTAENMIRAADSEGCSSIIRLGTISETDILKSLDIGAQGILVAHVESADDARRVVEHAKYHPLGRRGFSPYTRAGGYGSTGIENHTIRENEQTLVGIIIEGRKGIDAIEEIARVPGLDLIYIGAYDLSQALGMPGHVRHPEVRACLERCMGLIRKAGLIPGGYVARNQEDMEWMLSIGMQFITFLPDVTIFSDTCKNAVEDFRKSVQARKDAI